MSASRPAAVLFACNMNSIRSPMAAALARRRFGKWLHVESCGVMAGMADPFAEFVMDELGVDMSGHEAKAFEDLEENNFDLIISLTQEADSRAKEITKGLSVETEFWPIPDPTMEAGSRERRLEAFRALRDDLDRRIAARFADLSTNPL